MVKQTLLEFVQSNTWIASRTLSGSTQILHSTKEAKQQKFQKETIIQNLLRYHIHVIGCDASKFSKIVSKLTTPLMKSFEKPNSSQKLWKNLVMIPFALMNRPMTDLKCLKSVSFYKEGNDVLANASFLSINVRTLLWWAVRNKVTFRAGFKNVG